MKTRQHSALALLFGALAVACVAQQPEVCYSGLALHYRYELNPTRANLFGAEVSALTILAFDERGLFHEAFEVTDPAQLGDDNLIHLPLPDGRWDILTWGGDMASFGIGGMVRDSGNTSHDVPLEKGVTSIDNARLWIENHTPLDDGGKLVTDHLSNLYYGLAEGLVSRNALTPPVTRTVEMMRNTNTLRVVVRGLPPGSVTRADGEGQIVATADMTNERCRADNGICDQVRATRHVRTGTPVAGLDSLAIDLTVMRLLADDATSRLTLSGELLASLGIAAERLSIPIVPTILSSDAYDTQEHLDRENLYVFEFVLDGTGGIELYINKWRVVDTVIDI